MLTQDLVNSYCERCWLPISRQPGDPDLCPDCMGRSLVQEAYVRLRRAKYGEWLHNVGLRGES